MANGKLVPHLKGQVLLGFCWFLTSEDGHPEMADPVYQENLKKQSGFCLLRNSVPLKHKMCLLPPCSRRSETSGLDQVSFMEHLLYSSGSYQVRCCVPVASILRDLL